MMAGLRKVLRVAAVAGLTALLAACVSPPPVSDGGPDVVADGFSRTGRFAVRVEAPGEQPEAVQGGFAWRDQGRRLVLDLANPFGSTLARMEATSQGAVLTRANGEVFRAANPDALIAEVLGGDIPVSGLRDWLRGRLATDPAAQEVRKDDTGRPTAFQQGGWQAVLSRYDALGPQLLVLERNEAGRRIVVRLVVDAAQP